MADHEKEDVNAKPKCSACSELIKKANSEIKCSVCQKSFHKNCVQKYIHGEVLTCASCEAQAAARTKKTLAETGASGSNLPSPATPTTTLQRRNDVNPEGRTVGSADEVKKYKAELARVNKKMADAVADLKLRSEEIQGLKNKLKTLEEKQADDGNTAELKNELSTAKQTVADLETRASETLLREQSAIADLQNCRVEFDKELAVLRNAVESEKLRRVAVETELAAVKSKEESAEVVIADFKDLVKSLNNELAENVQIIDQLHSTNDELNRQLSEYQSSEEVQEENIDPPLNATATPFVPELQEARELIRDSLNFQSSRSNRPDPPTKELTISRSNSTRAASTRVMAEDSVSVSGDSQSSLNEQQAVLNTLVIRQNLKSLPKFSGEDITKWAEFEEVYNRATKRGSFDQIDNVERLRECLCGPARTHVAHLLYGENADAIMNELRFLYGRTEDQVAELFSRVDKLPMLKGSRDPNFSHFVQTVSDYVMRLKQLDMKGDLGSLTIVTNIAKKLIDTPYHEKWESLKERDPGRVHGLEELSDLLRLLWSRLPSDYKLAPKPSSQNKSNSNQQRRQKSAHHVLHHVPNQPQSSQSSSVSFSASSDKSCIFCKKSGHFVSQCFKFRSRPIGERNNFVKENNLCVGCMRTGHKLESCTYKRECGMDGCKRFHHRALHLKQSQENGNSSSQVENPASQLTQQPVQQNAAGAPNTHMSVFIPHNLHTGPNKLAKIGPCRIYGRYGKFADTLAYFDDGSHITIIERQLAADVNLPGEMIDLDLQWTSKVTRKEHAMKCSFEIRGANCSKTYRFDNVYAIDDLSLPYQTQDAEALKARYKHLRGIKIPSFTDAKPRILIGLQHARFLNGQVIFGPSDNEPVATKTRLGWLVYGNTEVGGSRSCLSGIHFPVMSIGANIIERSDEQRRADDELHELVKRSMTTESFGVSPTAKWVKSRDDERAEQIMKSTLRFVNGRYEIGFLWKRDNIRLPDSYPMAVRRLHNLEKSLEKKPEIREWMENHFVSLIAKGYARIATEEDLNTEWTRVWYLPTFVTYNKNKTPPKPRCVWDFAAKHKGDGVSLNSFLLTGPDNIASLIGGLTRFRENAVAVNGDVKEMFHQINLTAEDQQCQRWIWKFKNEVPGLNVKVGEPTTLILQVLGFGPTDSPAKSQEVKNFHAEKYRESCPEASEALQKFTYVDDYFNSHATVEEAIRVTQDAIKICADMKFDLVAIQSNSQEVLQALPSHNVKEDLVNLDVREHENYVTKVLGMYWDAKKDVFLYCRKDDELMQKMTDPNFLPTKREALKIAMRTFDPLGFAAKYLIRGRMAMQEIWRAGIDWDEKINEELLLRWSSFLRSFDYIEKIRIPRHYAPVDPARCRVELIAFVDASDSAFASVCYFRFTFEGEVFVALAGAKAKVAPVNPLTIPQLELQGCVLGVRQVESLTKLHSFEIHERRFLTDSTCVLSWIRDPKSKQNQFVGSRIGEILEKSSSSEWFHIRTHLNVADEATKVTPEVDEVENSRWFTGPDFMKLPLADWPITQQKYTAVVNTHINVEPENSIDRMKAKFRANWNSLVRTVAYMRRFLRMLIKKEERPHQEKFISAVEFARAEISVFHKIQRDAYPEEYKSLVERSRYDAERKSMMNSVSRSSSLSEFLPFLDDNAVIRMSSRNQKIKFSYAARNPIILPNRHELVSTFIRYHHERNHHFGTETVVANIRETAWIISIRTAVLRVKLKCVWCKLMSAKPDLPLTGELHDATTAFEHPPFTFVGVDCFGPVYIKRGRGTEKRWVVLFTCLTFRAIHLEILYDSSADSMLGAIRKVVGRRGRVAKLFSDNATNFTGSNNTNRRDHEEILHAFGEKIANEMRIDWHFIPAYSPWMGGAWEKLIGLVKRVMRDTLPADAVEENVLSNILIEAEIIVNDRPLTHTPTNPEDDRPLTPNLKLFGPKQPPRYVVASCENDVYSSDSYYMSQAYADRFAARWTREYLPEISRRAEKSLGRKKIQLDDIVLVTEPNEKRSDWKMGRVVKTHPSKDGVVRKIDVLMKDGKIQAERSVGRCALFDIRGDAETSAP